MITSSVCRKLTGPGYAIKFKKLRSDSKAEKHTAGLVEEKKHCFQAFAEAQ